MGTNKEELYSLILNQVEDIVYIVDLTKGGFCEGSVMFVGNKVKNVIGSRAEDFVKDPRLWMELIHPDDRQRVIDETRNIILRKASGMRTYRVWNRITGEYSVLEDKTVPKIDETGNVTALIGLARDVTQNYQQAQQLKYRTTLLEAITDAMTYFLSTGKIRKVSDRVLSSALKVTSSQSGFIGVVEGGGTIFRLLSGGDGVWKYIIRSRLAKEDLCTSGDTHCVPLSHLQSEFSRVIDTCEPFICNEVSILKNPKPLEIPLSCVHC